MLFDLINYINNKTPKNINLFNNKSEFVQKEIDNKNHD